MTAPDAPGDEEEPPSSIEPRLEKDGVEDEDTEDTDDTDDTDPSVWRESDAWKVEDEAEEGREWITTSSGAKFAVWDSVYESVFAKPPEPEPEPRRRVPRVPRVPKARSR